MIFVQTSEHRQDINYDVIVSLTVSRLVTWQQMPLLLVVQCVNYQTNCRVWIDGPICTGSGILFLLWPNLYCMGASFTELAGRKSTGGTSLVLIFTNRKYTLNI